MAPKVHRQVSGGKVLSPARSRWMGGRAARLAGGVVIVPSVPAANRLPAARLASSMAEHGPLWSRSWPHRPSGVLEAVDANAGRWLETWLAWGSSDRGRLFVPHMKGQAMTQAILRGRSRALEALLAGGVRPTVSDAIWSFSCSPAWSARLVESLPSLSSEAPQAPRFPPPNLALPSLPIFHAAIQSGHLPALRALCAHPQASPAWAVAHEGLTPLERSVLSGIESRVWPILEAGPPPMRKAPVETWLPSRQESWRRALARLTPSGLSSLLVCLGVSEGDPDRSASQMPLALLHSVGTWPGYRRLPFAARFDAQKLHRQLTPASAQEKAPSRL